MDRTEGELDEMVARSLAWSSTSKSMDRQTNVLESMGAQYLSVDDEEEELDDASEPRLKFELSLITPPGLRPETILLKMTMPDTGRTIMGRPGINLLTLMADMKRAGHDEAQIIDALNKQLSTANSEQESIDTDRVVVASRPEFAEIMQRVDAARDLHGVPATAQQAITDFIVRFSESILDHPFSPMLPVCLKTITSALAVDNMAPSALSRLSYIVESCHANLKAEMARIERKRVNRQKHRH